jgi:hypothetical protein
MAEKYSKEQLWKLYEILPSELQEAVFSEEIANSIYETCTKNAVDEKKISEVARYIGYVLMGLLPPDELEKTLEFKLALTNEQAKNINQEITRLVFSPLRATLQDIYKKEAEQVAKPKSVEKKPVSEEISKPREEKPSIKKRGKDVYRELTE